MAITPFLIFQETKNFVNLLSNEIKPFSFRKITGIEVFFDVNLGAELTVMSYLDYIKKKSPAGNSVGSSLP